MTLGILAFSEGPLSSLGKQDAIAVVTGQALTVALGAETVGAGTTVVETVFSWPGLGRLAINSVTGNDFPVVAAIMFFTMLLYVVVVLFLDLIYAFIDPRIRAK